MLVPYEMTSTRRIIFVWLVLVTIIVGSFVRIIEGSRYHADDDNDNSPRHRHRHRHDAGTSRRNHELSSSRRAQWSQLEDDYEDAIDVDDNNDNSDEDEDEEYEMERSRTMYERNHQPSRNVQRSYHSRFESRYPLRYHQTSHRVNHPSYRGGVTGVVDEDAKRHRNSRYGGSNRGHRSHSGRERTSYHDDRKRDGNTGGYTSRNHEFEDPEEDIEDEDDLERDTNYDRASRRRTLDDDTDENSQDYRGNANSALSRWRNSRRYRPGFEHHEPTQESKVHRGRQESRRNDWKSRNSISAAPSSIPSVKRNGDDNWIDRKRKKERKRTRISIDDTATVVDDDFQDVRNEKDSWSNKKSKNHVIADRKKDNNLDDRDYENDDNGETKKSDKKIEEDKRKMRRREEEEKEEDQEDKENIWKDADDNEDGDDDDDNFDRTNYYKTENEPPYKTFDDIIKSLTSDDPTTPKPTLRREYRKIGIEKYLKRDAYGNMYDPRNVTTKFVDNLSGIGKISNRTHSGNKWHAINPDVTNYSNTRDSKKITNSIGDAAIWKGNKEHDKRRVHSKLDESATKTKSLEQEYEDYEIGERDENVVRIGGQQVTEMQADINNAVSRKLIF